VDFAALAEVSAPPYAVREAKRELSDLAKD
jgi:hypothetical protein